MIKLIQPTDYTGTYPDGWAGFTWCDWDQSAGSYHPGDDYNWGATGQADYDRAVLSIADARVLYTSRATTGYGNMVILEIALDRQTIDFISQNFPKYQRKSEKICVLFAHLNQIYVTAGQVVKMGQLIATIGNSGTTYAHLHAELYEPNGELITKPYRFYPVGWSKDKIETNYLPFFTFIEKAKQNQEIVSPSADEYVQRLSRDLQSCENTITAGEQIKDPQWKEKNKANKNKLLSLASRL